MRIIFGLTLALSAGAATAQSTSTDCYGIGNTVHCDTRSPQSYQPTPPINYGAMQRPADPAASYSSGFALGEQIRAARERRREEAAARAEAQQQAARQASREELARVAGDMIAKGQCADAAVYLLRNGEPGMAQTTSDICASLAHKP